jgi:hypothetical protein
VWGDHHLRCNLKACIITIIIIINMPLLIAVFPMCCAWGKLCDKGGRGGGGGKARGVCCCNLTGLQRLCMQRLQMCDASQALLLLSVWAALRLLLYQGRGAH